MIEVTDNADAARAGCPNSKVDTTDAFNGSDVSAKFFVGVVVTALAHEMKIEFAQEKGEGVGVVHFKRFVVVGAAFDFVAPRRGWTGLAGGPRSFKDPFGAKLYRI